MKKYAYFALTLVLTAVLLVGCGCTNRNMDNTSAPTVLPTNEEIWDSNGTPTNATTEATTTPATTDVIPGNTDETIDRGNGPLEDNTTGTTNTTEATVEGRARQNVPNGR